MLKRVFLIGSALAVAGALLAFVGLASGTRSAKYAAQVPAGGSVTTIANTATAAAKTVDYWSAARVAAAKPLALHPAKPAGMSFGTSGLDFTRSRITPQAANIQPPYKGVGKLYFTIPGSGDFQCSASLVAKRLIVTAGHCVHGGGQFYTN